MAVKCKKYLNYVKYEIFVKANKILSLIKLLVKNSQNLK